jgi:lipid-binding SYLF domain-containing protein
MKTVVLTCMSVAIAGLFLSGCSTTPKTASDKMAMQSKVQAAMTSAKEKDPALTKFFDNAVGYAVFPTVGKGAIGVGGAYGKGELYQSGQMVGYCTLAQASIGLALGGQTYTEIIFFENQAALDKFKSGNFAFAAQASAVALTSGAAANAKYASGVAVFTMGEAGLMYEASIGGQKFTYEPKMM